MQHTHKPLRYLSNTAQRCWPPTLPRPARPPPARRLPAKRCRLPLPAQDWAALPHSLLGDIFRRLLEQHTALEDIVKAWQVGAAAVPPCCLRRLWAG